MSLYTRSAKRLQEIEERKAELLEVLMSDDESVDLEEVEKELVALSDEKTKIERKQQLAQELAAGKLVTRPNERADDSEKKNEWRSLGEFVQAIAYRKHDPRLQRVEERAQSMDGGTPPGSEGGFLVPEQFSRELLTVSPDEAIIRPRARVLSDGSDANFHIPAIQYTGTNMFGGVQVEWIAEGDEKPETDVTFRQVTLQPHEVAAHVRVTDKLLRNAPVIETIVRTLLRQALIAAEERAFLTGDGVGKPTGIIGHPATVSVSRATPGQVAYEDVAAMYQRFRGQNGVWIASRSVLPELMALADANGNYIWQPSARDGSPGTLFGMPVLFSDDSPLLGEPGDIVLADLGYYLIRDGAQITMAVSPHVEFTRNITYIKAFKTVDGAPWLDGPLPTNPPSSPFVQLNS